MAEQKSKSKNEDKKDDPKKLAAQEAAREASLAAEAAAKAAAEAKEKAEKAAAAAAEAEGLVLVSVPRRYGVMVQMRNNAGEVTGHKVLHVEAGTQRVTREVAEHPYSKSHGVKVIGLPT